MFEIKRLLKTYFDDEVFDPIAESLILSHLVALWIAAVAVAVIVVVVVVAVVVIKVLVLGQLVHDEVDADVDAEAFRHVVDDSQRRPMKRSVTLAPMS